MVASIKDSGVKITCCGEPMTLLYPGTVEASVEKHVPAVTYENGVAKLGIDSSILPMIEECSTKWIF
ncbi:desulfoferrodoxin [Clostridium saccharoperbutylacetonicum]|uniref:desulfoferrodoxin n=1 Tax=Clostridium saccharoperbutylacetonicum TaxID=36745 RepID=UPI0039ED3F16